MKRFVAVFLSFVMMLGLFSVSAFALDSTGNSLLDLYNNLIYYPLNNANSTLGSLYEGYINWCWGGDGSAPTESSGDTGCSVNYVYNTTTNINRHQSVNTTNNVWYNPVTNNYSTYNNITYNQEYNTYNITNNEYNAYITNNYTYVTYVISTDQQSYYYEIYYQLPDGRNSYNLTAEDVWGQYFIYDATTYDYVAEDDGKTLALFHFDGNLQDSSANNCQAVYEGTNASYTYVDSDFGSALKMSGNDYKLNITLPESLDGDFTIEGRARFSGPILELGEISQPAYDITQGEAFKDYGWKSLDDTKAWLKEYCGDGEFVFRGGDENYYWMSYNLSTISLKACNLYNYTLNTFLKTNNWFFWLPNKVTYDTTYYDFFSSFGVNNNGFYYANGDVHTLCGSSFRRTYGCTITNSVANGCDYTMPSDYFSFAFQRKDGKLYYYQNGILQGTWDNSDDFGDVITLYTDSAQTAYWDELRVTNEALYTSNYTPSSQPWDTNKVFVLPETGEENQIAIMSLQEPGALRVGGVRPTFPGDGDVYVALSGDVVTDVQQYQVNGWVSIGASIWSDGSWHLFIGWDCGKLVIDGPGGEDPSPSPSPGPDDDSGSGGGSSGGGWLDDIFSDGLMAAFAGVVGVIGVILGGLLTLLAAIFGFLLTILRSIPDFFPFIPDGLAQLIGSGIVILFVLAIVKFIRGLL